MARTPLLARMSLDEVRCNEEGDGFGSAEPYLWAVFFKIDGDSVIVGDDTHLQGECTIVASDGSHGNLGDRDVDAGDTLVVPTRIGEFRTTLRPIPYSAKLQETDPGGDAPGVLGAVVVLLEEDQVSDAGARAGYAALVDFVRQAINNDIIPSLYLYKQDISDDEISKLVNEAFDAVEGAIRSVQSSGQNFWSWVDGDDTIGFRLLRFTLDDLDDNYWDVNEHFQTVAPNGAVVDDRRVTGEVQGARPTPYNYTHARRSEDVGAPAAAAGPTTCPHPATGVQNIVYRDARGHLHELWRDAIGQVGTTDPTDNAGATAATGDPYAYLETTTDIELVLYRDGGGDGVHSLYWSTGAVGLDNLSLVAGAQAAGGIPVGHFNPATGTHHVVYRSGDGHLHVIYWTGASDPAHYEGPLTGALNGPSLAAGDPSAYFNAAENVVVYRARDNHVHDLYWSGGGVGHEDLTGTAWPAAAGDPVAYYIPGLDLQQVTYRTGQGELYELSWRGPDPAAGRNLMEGSGAPVAVSDPAVFYSPATNTEHVIYRGPFGHLFELWFVPGGQPAVVDLTLEARAPRAVGRPAAFTVDAANTRYAVYRGFDNQIHEISWAANPWTSPGRQSDWRWCNRCQGLFYGGNVASSSCPTGGAHTAPGQSGSADYYLPYGGPFV